MDYELAIIGSGPAGYSAGIYAGRSGIKAAIFDRGDGSVILQDIKTGQAYVIQFDSLQQTIKQLDQWRKRENFGRAL